MLYGGNLRNTITSEDPAQTLLPKVSHFRGLAIYICWYTEISCPENSSHGNFVPGNFVSWKFRRWKIRLRKIRLMEIIMTPFIGYNYLIWKVNMVLGKLIKKK